MVFQADPADLTIGLATVNEYIRVYTFAYVRPVYHVYLRASVCLSEVLGRLELTQSYVDDIDYTCSIVTRVIVNTVLRIFPVFELAHT